MLRRKQLLLLFTLVSVIMFTLIGVQAYWLRSNYQLHEKNFDEKVNKALTATAAGMDKLLFSFFLYSKTYIQPGEGVFLLKHNSNGKGSIDTLPLFNAFVYPDRPDTCFYSTGISYYDHPVIADVSFHFEYFKNDAPTDFSTRNSLLKTLTRDNYKSILNDTLHMRSRMQSLDSILKSELAGQGISSAYTFGVKKANDAEYFYTSGKDLGHDRSATYEMALFKQRGYLEPYQLQVTITNKDQLMRGGMISIFITSLVVVLGLGLLFYYLFRIVLQQKKLHEMKTDFINNMTHEFMTPVTNIGLAVETLERSKKEKDATTRQMMELITVENQHIKESIQKVLQAATIEDGALYAANTTVDMHDIIRRTVRSFEPAMAATGGSFTLHLNASVTSVQIDETHLINLLYNIVDNAIKYASAERKLAVSIATENKGNWLTLTIEDNGRGMSKGEQRLVFDKFYRTRKGNVQDVKGFGLGLHYVKCIADAYGLKLDVESVEEKSTIFTVRFKLASSNGSQN